MPPLVSVVIPCYNAERWVGEAIESCLKQTYGPVEVIVVDDGSTDNSLEILKRLNHKIRVEYGPNRGGSHARNRAVELSKGEYIQFLDADDFLLPEKIERQVSFLEETKADAVFGDWRHQYHLEDGAVVLGEVTVSGDQADVLESLLRGWWVANLAILFRRNAVVRSGGWNERLRAGQDRDFFTRVAMAGTDIRYQAGCHSIYRRYGNVTVSTGDSGRWLDSHRMILADCEDALTQAGKLSPKYQVALALSYFSLARNYFDSDQRLYGELMEKVRKLDPSFHPKESATYNAVQKLFGFAMAERLASFKRRAKKAVT